MLFWNLGAEKKIYFTYDKKNEIETPSMNIVTSSSTKYFLTAISEGYYDNPIGHYFTICPQVKMELED